MEKSKTLVTGGNGLIGSEFTECVKITRQDFDLVESAQVDEMYEIHQPKVVIHTAAKVGGVGANMKFKGDFFYENIMINTNVIHSAKNHKVDKLVAFLSTCIFPNNIEYPLTEDKIQMGPPHISNDAYAYSKRMVEINIKSYNEQFGTNYFCVIPTNVYGPNDNYNLENSHLLPAIIHKCYLAMLNKTDLTLWGNGKPLREFIFSKDVVKICNLLLEKNSKNESVIISTSQELEIKYIADVVCKIMGFKKKIVWDTSKPSGQFRKPSDNSKMKSIIGEFEFTDFISGVEETISYFIKNYDRLRK